MMGSIADAEDLVQETSLKAWRSLPTFEGRSSLRHWLYTIATNACLDSLARRKARPLEDGDPGAAATRDYIDPCPDALWQASTVGPEARMTARESVALSFIAALAHLAPLQRAVLLLRDVLGWSASEVAEQLGRSPSAVESALERARAATATRRASLEMLRPIDDPSQKELLARYLAAWEAGDPTTLTALLREDAHLTMPPHPLRLFGRQAIGAFLAPIFAKQGRVRARLVGVSGGPGIAGWLESPTTGRFHAHALSCLHIEAGQIDEVHTYLLPELFPRFGLPLEMER
jgi:RNA polymerase sigma-70 factor (ECF subfamily)